MSRVADRITRATAGAWDRPDREHDQPQLRAEQAQQQQREHQLREREDHVDGAHDDPVGRPAQVRGRDAGRGAGHDADRGRGHRHQQQQPSAVEHPGEHVPAEKVAAQRELPGRLGERQRQPASFGECGETAGPMTATSTTRSAIVEARRAPWRAGRRPQHGQPGMTPGRRGGRPPGRRAGGGASAARQARMPAIATSGSGAAVWPAARRRPSRCSRRRRTRREPAR